MGGWMGHDAAWLALYVTTLLYGTKLVGGQRGVYVEIGRIFHIGMNFVCCFDHVVISFCSIHPLTVDSDHLTAQARVGVCFVSGLPTYLMGLSGRGCGCG